MSIIVVWSGFSRHLLRKMVRQPKEWTSLERTFKCKSSLHQRQINCHRPKHLCSTSFTGIEAKQQIKFWWIWYAENLNITRTGPCTASLIGCCKLLNAIEVFVENYNERWSAFSPKWLRQQIELQNFGNWKSTSHPRTAHAFTQIHSIDNHALSKISKARPSRWMVRTTAIRLSTFWFRSWMFWTLKTCGFNQCSYSDRPRLSCIIAIAHFVWAPL